MSPEAVNTIFIDCLIARADTQRHGIWEKGRKFPGGNLGPKHVRESRLGCFCLTFAPAHAKACRHLRRCVACLKIPVIPVEAKKKPCPGLPVLGE